jgi:glutaredoxin 3
MSQKPVTIYTTPTCHFCQLAKEFFAEKGIEYTNYDVASDTAKRAEMIKLTGQLGVPVIVIGGETVIGFSRGKVAEKLGIEA